jgi:ligand-binding sensor domain-containing protein/signal transduction histidine kinase
MRNLFITITVLLVSASCESQSYYFRHYQVENGLSNNTVFCSAQDKNGFLWMGTKDGLNRFDGYNFKVFRNDPDDSTSIGDNFIRSLFIDKDNQLYAGTQNGLYKFDPLMEKFSLVYKTLREIRDIKKDDEENLWFITDQTLIKYNEKTKAHRVYKPDKYFASTSICIDINKKIWVSTANGLLEQYNPAKDSFTPYHMFDEKQNLFSKWIEKIYATNQGSILVGTSNYGVKLFNLKDLTYKNILTYNPDKTEIFAHDFVQNSETEFWMATESGVFIYNIITGKFINLKKKYTNPYSISDNAVYTLCKDKEGGIWAGTYFGGANYFPKQYNSFEKYFPDYSASSISGNAVREICEDKFGNLWIGTEDAGLNKLNKETGVFTQYKPSGKPTDISYSNIHGLLARNDELWIGTFEHGLDIMNIKTSKVIKHYPGNQNSKVLKSNFIVTILQTKKGDIFIGTREGLYRFNAHSGDFTNIPQVPSDCFIHTLKEDKDSTLWIGTIGSGLFFYNESKNKSGSIVYSSKNKKGISSNSIISIFEDYASNMWFGTEGGGLCKFNKQDSSFTHYTSKDGFPGNTIFKILEDNNKNLWITTSKGLVCFNPATKKINIYTTSNGLLSDQFNYSSGYKDSSGKMYFGCVKGLISFNPDAIIANTFVPPLFITGVSVNNKELAVSANNKILHQSILFTKSIKLDHDQSSLNIDFAALSFTAPETIEYKYIMEGLDKDWTYLKTNRKVYFTNLSPGTYTFKVKASNSSSVWNEKETKLSITILPPIWKTPWAYVLYVVLAGLLIFYSFRSYHRRVDEKNRRRLESFEHEKEKEIYKAKIDFFTNVAHEIRTPLTLIKAPLEKIIKKAGDNIEIGHNLKIMERNTDRLIELTNQLLDFRKIETNAFELNYTRINITELLLERYISFKTIAEQKQIMFTIYVPPKPIYAYADADSLHKIFNNLFNNALSYCTSKTEVHLFMENENAPFFYIEFSNDGLIIPKEMKEKIFEPFYRLKEAHNKPGNGIGLALSKSLAILHKGELYLKEADNGMNIFVIRLPINQPDTVKASI